MFSTAVSFPIGMFNWYVHPYVQIWTRTHVFIGPSYVRARKVCSSSNLKVFVSCFCTTCHFCLPVDATSTNIRPRVLLVSCCHLVTLLGTDAISSLAEIRAREEVATQRAQVVTDMLSELAVYLSQRMRIEATERAIRQAARQATGQAVEQTPEQATRQTATTRLAATGGGERISSLAPLALEIEAAVRVGMTHMGVHITDHIRCRRE